MQAPTVKWPSNPAFQIERCRNPKGYPCGRTCVDDPCRRRYICDRFQFRRVLMKPAGHVEACAMALSSKFETAICSSSPGAISRTNAIASTRSAWRYREDYPRTINGRHAVLSSYVAFFRLPCDRKPVKRVAFFLCPFNLAAHHSCISRLRPAQVVPHNKFLAMYSPSSVNVLAFDPEPEQNNTTHETSHTHS